MAEQIANDAVGQLAVSIDTVDTSLTLTDSADAALFPTTGDFRIRVDDELMLVGARSGASLSSITRAVEGTAAASHGSGSQAEHVLTAQALRNIAGYFALETDAAVGATSVTLSAAPNVRWVPGAVIVISAGTTRAEMKSILSVSGDTITVSALNTAHTAADEVILLVAPYIVSPEMYGCALGTVDNWAPLQRAVYETTAFGIKLAGTTGQRSAGYEVSKPILVPTGSVWDNLGFKTHSSFGPADPAGAMVMVGGAMGPFTAEAATDTITCAHGVVSANNQPIAFTTPYGGTIPGGITEGKVYYVKTRPSASTLTVSATPGGATLDITSDGSGYFLAEIDVLARVYWNDVRFDLTVADVNGVRMCLQQPSYTRGLRVEMDAAATTRAYGVVLSGQISNNFSWEINTCVNGTGAYITGTGHNIFGFNCNGQASGDIGIDLQGAVSFTVAGLWTEQCGTAGVRIGSGTKAAKISGSWYHSVADTTKPALLVESANSSYSIDALRTSSGNSVLISDTARGYSLNSWDGGTAGNSDRALTLFKFSQEYPTANVVGPVFGSRRAYFTNTSYTAVYLDETVFVDTTAAVRTITLPTAVGFAGIEFTVSHRVGGVNGSVVATTSSQTINGASTYALTLGQAVTVVSDGSNWRISGIVQPAGSIATSSSQSGTTYTLALTDANTFIEFTNGSAVTVTIPANADVPFDTDTVVEITQMGAGQVSIVGDTGVTVLSPGSKNKTAAQYATASLRKRDTNTWLIEGDIVA